MKFRIAERVVVIHKHKPMFVNKEVINIIYQNPSVSDLNSKEETGNNRTIIDLKGNLFVETAWVDGGIDKDDYSTLLHAQLLKILHDNGKCLEFTDTEENGLSGLCLLRNHKTNNFFLADYDEETIIKHKNTINNILKKCKEKNPYFNFIFYNKGKHEI